MTNWCLSCCIFVTHLVLNSFTVAFSFADTNTRNGASVVTGANGYLGKSIVHELLDQGGDGGGEDILCLVRQSRVSSEKEYWQRVSSSSSTTSSNVQVLPYDMLDGGDSLKQALQKVGGPCCVYHVASKFGPTENHRQTALDNVQGTEELVRTVAEHSKDHRIVITSSMAAVRGTGQTPKNGKYYTSEDWNTVSELGANWGASYQWSKAESEKRAVDLAKKLGIEIVSMCPSFVFGPPRDLESTASFSITLVGQWARGESPIQSRLFVDVRDVAAAHVAAGKRKDSSGKRFIISTEARVSSKEIASWLSHVCAESGLSDPNKIHFDAEFSGGAISIGEKEVEAEQRLKQELGVELHPVKDTIVGMATTLLVSKVQQ
mmetsp:Transcript_19416/g.25043  ORF Transcript_19416/g.25043 Transcript_19416/m.25043 type:complete len:376 (-) Transcript_19416:41-1168(-)